MTIKNGKHITMATNSIEYKIDPSHLMYHVVRGNPLISLTELDALIFAGMCSFVDHDGVIKLSQKDREHLMTGLKVSPQQMSNTIKRLTTHRVLVILHKGKYLLGGHVIGLKDVPAKMKHSFTIKFTSDAQPAQSTNLSVRDVEDSTAE